MASSLDSFHWLDYVIFSIMLLVSCGIGVFYALRTKKPSKEDYLMGNRRMAWFPVALSLLVSYTSGITQLGKPAEIYQYGIQYIIGIMGSLLGMSFSVFTFVPLLFKLQLTSSYEYLELRFKSKAVRKVGSLTVILSQLIYIGLALYSPAVALQAVTGFSVSVSMLVIGAVATFYTVLGGMKAVVWTDAFQAFIMLASILSIIIFGTIAVGGPKRMLEVSGENGRLNFFNFDPNPLVRMTFWSVVLGKCFGWMPYYAVNQASVQRYSCVPTLKKAKQIVMLNVPSFLFIDFSMCVIGMIIYTYFSQCDPLTDPDPEQRVTSPNQIVPVFVMKVMGWPGIPGVFLAGIFSGSLSTVSSCLNAIATITWEDFLMWKLDYLSEKVKTYILKLLVLIFGVAGVCFAFMASSLRGHLMQLSSSFLDTSGTPMMGLFILGAFFRKTNWLGAIIGAFCGLMLPMWMSFGSYLLVSGYPKLPTSVEGCAWNITAHMVNSTASWLNATTLAPAVEEPLEGLDRLYRVSFMYYPVIGTLTTVVVGLVCSRITAPFIDHVLPEDVKENYLIYALDSCSRPKDRKFVQTQDAVDDNELKELKSIS